MKYGNINTNAVADDLPSVMVLTGQTITGATIEQWKSQGWRTVVQEERPASGYRVTAYNVIAIDGNTCRLTIAASVNIADEAAAAAAAALAEQKAIGKDLLDTGKDNLVLVLRAFALLALQEINTLRTKAGLATYTQAQFWNALKAKVDGL